MVKIGIIEDERAIADKIAEKLQQWQYEAVIFSDFEHIDRTFFEEVPDLLIMDIKLPSFDGFYWARKIREKSVVPILFLSSQTEPLAKITSMTVGGDYFMEKPFNLDVLVSSIQALLRRNREYQQSSVTFSFEGLSYDTENFKLSYGDKEIELTKNEGILLRTFIHNSSRFLSRDELMEALWNESEYVNDNTLTVNVNRLRKRLVELTDRPFIETKRGVGYKL